MKSALGSAAACALAWMCVASSTPAAAQTFSVVPNASHVVDLDTGDGSFSVWEANDLTGIDSVRASFIIRRIGSDPKWSPLFNFAVTKGDDSVALRIVSIKRGAPMVIYLTHQRGAKQVSDEMFLTFLQVGETAELTMTWTASGDVIATLKSPESLAISPTGERHEAALGGAPTTFHVGASTGELEVKPLQLGRTSS